MARKADQRIYTDADQAPHFPRTGQMCGALERVQFRYAQFGSGFHVGFHHALEDSAGKAEQQTMNSHLSRKKNSSHP